MSGAESQNKRWNLWPHEPGPSMLSWWHHPLDYLYTFSMLYRQVVSPLEPRPIIISSYGFSPEEMREGSPAPSCVSMKSAHSKDPPLSFKQAEEEREDPPALRREITKKEFLEERLAFRRQVVSPLEPRPHLPPSERRSCPEKETAGSPASSSGSMKSARSMNFPVSFKQPASCESVKSDQSMGPPLSFKRRQRPLDYLRTFSMLPSERSFGSRAEEEEEVSPALSCESMKSFMPYLFLSNEIQG